VDGQPYSFVGIDVEAFDLCDTEDKHVSMLISGDLVRMHG
jgi:hypothetical protein